MNTLLKKKFVQSKAVQSKILQLATKAVSAALIAVLGMGMVACSSSASSSDTGSATSSDTSTTVRIASLSGPTSIGLVDLMNRAESEELAYTYDFTIATAADEITTGLIQGDFDIALLPANAASVVYNRTEGAITVIDINTLGVLYVVTGDESVTSLADLAGKTIYTTGKGTTPEYALNYVLAQNGLSDQVTIEFRSESTELAAILSEDSSAICLLPEPYATVALSTNDALHRVASLSDEWDALQTEDGSAMVTGVTVVRTEFLEAHPEAVADFLAEHQTSVDYVNANPTEAGELVAEIGIIESASVAANAIPNCSLVCITGEEMKAKLEGYLQVLYDQDASSIGGAMPGDDFYVTELSW